eukprot:TRINITY_DN85191_c0_g1_i1.p1 TRINITY_DN85191_c0_g1~~TRINITY_DN85191_c0_g1_i1.p1  ORF type:complete len:482 (+),score=86.93 TRINITY_DN85191_c0_g1_i1:92-1537(+)
MAGTKTEVQNSTWSSALPCAQMLGLLLLLNGLLDTYLYFKFTPVYAATTCGQQTAALDKFKLGSTLQIGLHIEVTCWNPNGYEVQIRHDTPGKVFIGKHREIPIGELTMLFGSTLPAEGPGKIKVQMDTELPLENSETLNTLAHEFLSASEIPIFLELQFNVAVDINFGLTSFGTTAPFKKRCGMKLAGLFAASESRLGPMICRDSFQGLFDKLPDTGVVNELTAAGVVDSAVASVTAGLHSSRSQSTNKTPLFSTPGDMEFSAAQMDPERVAMGERMKDICLLGSGSVCYLLGFLLSFSFLKSLAARLMSYLSSLIDSLKLHRGDNVNFPLHGVTVDVRSDGYSGLVSNIQSACGLSFSDNSNDEQHQQEHRSVRSARRLSTESSAEEAEQINKKQVPAAKSLLGFLTCGSMTKDLRPQRKSLPLPPQRDRQDGSYRFDEVQISNLSPQPACLRARSGNLSNDSIQSAKLAGNSTIFWMP